MGELRDLHDKGVKTRRAGAVMMDVTGVKADEYAQVGGMTVVPQSRHSGGVGDRQGKEAVRVKRRVLDADNNVVQVDENWSPYDQQQANEGKLKGIIQDYDNPPAPPEEQGLIDETPAPAVKKGRRQAAPQNSDMMGVMMQMMQQMMAMKGGQATPQAAPQPQIPQQPRPAPQPQQTGVSVSFAGLFGTIKGMYAEVIEGDGCLVLVSRMDAQQMFLPPVSCDVPIAIAVNGGAAMQMFNVGLSFAHTGNLYTVLMRA